MMTPLLVSFLIAWIGVSILKDVVLLKVLLDKE